MLTAIPVKAVPSAARPDRLIDINQVAHRLRVSKRTLYRRLAAGQLPRPAEQRHGVIAKWRESEIDRLIATLGR